MLSAQRPENRKEIYFRLTEKGQDIYKIHEQLHAEFQNRDKAVFQPVTEEQFDSMLRFVDRYNRHLDEELKKLDEEIKTGRGQ